MSDGPEIPHRLPSMTVIMPHFNQARYLESAITSVLDQGYEDLDFVIVDGGSCDESLDIIKEYEDELAWWTSVPDTGAAEAINKALRYADTELVAIVHADDVLLPLALYELAEQYMAAGRPAWMVGTATHIDANNTVVDRVTPSDDVSLQRYAMGGEFVLPRAACIRRLDVFERYGVFDPSLLHEYEFDFNCRMIAGGVTPVVVHETIAAMRVHDESMSASDPIGCGRERRRVVQQYAGAMLATASPTMRVPRPARRRAA